MWSDWTKLRGYCSKFKNIDIHVHHSSCFAGSLPSEILPGVQEVLVPSWDRVRIEDGKNWGLQPYHAFTICDSCACILLILRLIDFIFSKKFLISNLVALNFHLHSPLVSTYRFPSHSSCHPPCLARLRSCDCCVEDLVQTVARPETKNKKNKGQNVAAHVGDRFRWGNQVASW